MTGKAFVWGIRPIPENIIGIPEGAKVRFRVRNTEPMRCYIKHNGEVRDYILVADTLAGPWELMEQGMNTGWLSPRSPQYKDHLKLISKL